MTSAPSRLRAEHLDDPIGIDVRRPRLSWWLPEGVLEQEAYQVRVDGVEQDRVDADERVLVPWPADELVSGRRVAWEVRVWTKGAATGWSAPAVVEAGLLDPSDWSASWIEPDEGDEPGEPGQRPAPVLRHAFVLDGPVERARLYATAHGVYEAFLGGNRVGDQELTPGTTSYPSRLQVQTHDVTALLHEGGNELRVILSDGWWRGQTGNGRDHDCYGTTLAFLGQLHVDHPDGSRTVVVTDPSWTWTAGPIRGADLMAGQTVDLRVRLEGWAPVTVVDHGLENLCASPAPPMRRIEELRPVRITEPVPGHQVVDLDQNINGWVRLRGLGPAGTEVTLTHGEVLDDRGDVTIEHLLSADHTTGERLGEIQVDRVVAGPGPDDSFEPRHTSHGFQYVRVEGLDRSLTPDEVTAVVVHTDLRRTGWFHCSDGRINRLHDAAVWSFRDNACDIPTDCPQRERSGWTGDWQLFVPTAAYLYDVAGFSLKWLRDLAAEQRADGLVLNIAPEPRGSALWDDPIAGFLQGSAGWGDAAVIVPWELYRAYGDLDLVDELWPLMTGWVDFAAGRARAGRRAERVATSPEPADHEVFLWDTGFHWGEWCEPGGNDLRATLEKDIGHLATAYLHRSADLLSRMARLLGRDADAEHCRLVADGARHAWQVEYLADDGTVTPGDQATLVRALAFGLVPDEVRAAVAEQLVDAVQAAGNHLTTGFLATPLLLPTLADAGHLDVAYDLLLQDTPPAWLPMIDQGATTSGRPGRSSTPTAPASLNHYSKGAVISFLHTHTAGLHALDPAYRRFRVAPQPGGGITSAEAALDSPHRPDRGLLAAGRHRRHGYRGAGPSRHRRRGRATGRATPQPRSGPVARPLGRSLIGSGQQDGHGLPAADRGGRGQLHPGGVQVPLGEPVEELVEGDPSFEAGEAGTEAEVEPVPEREVVGVARGGCRRRRGSRSGGGRGSPTPSTTGRRCRRGWSPRGSCVLLVTYRAMAWPVGSNRRVSSIAFGSSERSSTTVPTLVGVLGEQLGQPTDEPAGGLVARAGEHGRVGEHLLAGEGAEGARLVLELGVEELGHEVVGGVFGPPVDVVLEMVAPGDVSSFTSMGWPGSVRRLSSVLLRTATWSCSGMPRSMPMTLHREHRGQLGDDVEPAGADERVEAVGCSTAGPGPRARPSGGGVKTRDMRPRCTVCTGGSSNMITPPGRSKPDRMTSRMSDRVLVKIFQLTRAFSMSACRDRSRSRRPRCGRSAPRPGAGRRSGTGRR